ncbi:MAG: Lacal_2735 family protein [Bacteroidetes bacterium]|nr:Lacal_2735 family protein [Bacteroidota bacterium]
MNVWLKKTIRLNMLKNNYSSLMKKSFELSVIAPEKSEKYHHKAEEVLEQIKALSIK